MSNLTPVLALDTSTSACSIALEAGGTTFSFHEVIPRQHNERILGEIQTLCHQAEIKLSAIQRLVVGAGPGSFVGCRLAASIAQGLALPNNLPVCMLSSLHIWAQSLLSRYSVQECVLVLDAKIGEAYVGHYAVNDQGVMDTKTTDKAVRVEQLPTVLASYNSKCIFTDLPEAVEHFGLAQEQILVDLFPDARDAITLVQQQGQNANWQQAEQALPVYLRQKSQWQKK